MPTELQASAVSEHGVPSSPAGRSPFVADSYFVALLYILFSLGAGRVFRFAFDDEIFTLHLTTVHRTLPAFLSFAATVSDVHPQLSYLFFSVLDMLGFHAEAQRAVCLLMTASAAAIVHRAALQALDLDTSGRVVGILLFSSVPLLVTHGDALRYIPLFTLLFALFLRDFLHTERLTARGAVLLGLMLSTDLLGGVVVACAALASLLRYGVATTAADSLKFGVALIVPGAFGVQALVALPHRWQGGASSIFGAPGLRALGQSLLGFFGGFDLGLLQAPAILPTVVATGFALCAALSQRRFVFVVLLYACMIVLGLAGFSISRAFAFVQLAGLAPIMWTLSRHQPQPWFAPLSALLICCQIFTFLPLRANDAPFKRNLAIPYPSLLASIEASISGRTAVIAIDPTVVWEIERRFGDRVSLCHLFRKSECEAGSVETLIIVSGHHSAPALEAAVAKRVTQAYAQFGAPAASVFGVDLEASLKSGILGTEIDPAILKLYVFHQK
jgi:hypothetical protein